MSFRPLKSLNPGALKELLTSEEDYLAYRAGVHLGKMTTGDLSALSVNDQATLIGSYEDTYYPYDKSTTPSGEVIIRTFEVRHASSPGSSIHAALFDTNYAPLPSTIFVGDILEVVVIGNTLDAFNEIEYQLGITGSAIYTVTSTGTPTPTNQTSTEVTWEDYDTGAVTGLYRAAFRIRPTVAGLLNITINAATTDLDNPVQTASDSILLGTVNVEPQQRPADVTDVYELYQNDSSVASIITESPLKRNPFYWNKDASPAGLKEMNDLELDIVCSRLLSGIFANDYPGTFRLASVSPGDNWVVFLEDIFVDTRSDGSSLSYSIWIKQTGETVPSAVRPLAPLRIGGEYSGIKELTDEEIEFTFGERMKSLIMSSKVGTYQLRSSEQGPPTEAGTWLAKGSAINTVREYEEDVFYLGLATFEINYTADYVADYTAEYAGNYTPTYEQDYVAEYVSTYQGADIIEPYTAEYEGVDVIITFTGDYEGAPYVGDSEVVYTSESQLPYTVDYSATYVGSYAAEFSDDYVKEFSITYIGDYALEFSADYVSESTADYIVDYTAEYIGDYTSEYAGDYTAEYNATYVGDYSDINFAIYVGNYLKEFTADYTSDYTAEYVGDYVKEFTADYTGDFSADYTGLTYVDDFSATFEGNSSIVYTGDFLADYVAGYVKESSATYTSESTIDYLGDFTETYTGDYTKEFSANYTSESTADYTKELSATYEGNSSATYTKEFSATYVGDYAIEPIAYVGSGTTTQGPTIQFNPVRYLQVGSSTNDLYWDGVLLKSGSLGVVPTDGVYRTYVVGGVTYIVAAFSSPSFFISPNTFYAVARQVTSDVDYISDAATYSGDYVGDSEIVYTGDFSADYTSESTADYTKEFSADYEGNSTQVYQGEYVSESGIIYTGDFSADYTVESTATYNEPYTSESTIDYTGDFSADYVSESTIDYIADYTGDSQADYTSESTATYEGNYSSESSATYTSESSAIYEGDYSAVIPENTYQGEYVSESTVTYVSEGTITYQGNYSSESSITYIGDFDATFTGDSQIDYLGEYQSESDATYTGDVQVDYEGDYISESSAEYLGKFSENYTGDYSGDYIPTYLGEYASEYTRTLTITYLGDYTPNYDGLIYESEYTAEYSAADVIETYTADYTGPTYLTDYNNPYSLYDTDVGPYLDDGQRLTTPVKIETYTLYVRTTAEELIFAPLGADAMILSDGLTLIVG